MLELCRTVRFAVDQAGATGPRSNSFSAYPPVEGLARFYQLHVRCAGEPDPATGYFMNITEIDAAVRSSVQPLFLRAAGVGPLLREAIRLLQAPLRGSVVSVTLDLSPFLNACVRSNAMSSVTLRQQYEFAAAHRLHAPQLSDEENRRVFGKCNNPAGHGHNYRLEVALRAPIDELGTSVTVAALDAWTERHVVSRLDHKHLNHDVPEFASLNPSVENIAKVIHGYLAPFVNELHPLAALEEISVWETSKTVCTYRG